MIFSFGTHCRYTSANASAASSAAGVSSAPIMMRSGEAWSVIAMPSRENSGLERTTQSCPPELAESTRAIASAVLTGTVERSTMILGLGHVLAIRRAIFSQCMTSGA